MNYTIKQGSTIIAYADNLDEALDAARDYEGGYVVGPQGKVVPDKVHGRVAWSNPTKNPWKRAGEKKLIASSNHWELYQVERSSPSGYGEGSPYYMLVNYKTGTTDYPIVYDDGTVAYDRPEAIPTYVRVMVEREIGKKNYGRVGGPDADRKGNPRLSAGMSPNRFDQKALKMGTKIEMEQEAEGVRGEPPPRQGSPGHPGCCRSKSGMAAVQRPRPRPATYLPLRQTPASRLGSEPGRFDLLRSRLGAYRPAEL